MAIWSRIDILDYTGETALPNFLFRLGASCGEAMPGKKENNSMIKFPAGQVCTARQWL